MNISGFRKMKYFDQIARNNSTKLIDSKLYLNNIKYFLSIKKMDYICRVIQNKIKNIIDSFIHFTMVNATVSTTTRTL